MIPILSSCAITILLSSATFAVWLVGAQIPHDWVQTLAILWGLMVPLGIGAAIFAITEGL